MIKKQLSVDLWIMKWKSPSCCPALHFLRSYAIHCRAYLFGL